MGKEWEVYRAEHMSFGRKDARESEVCVKKLATRQRTENLQHREDADTGTRRNTAIAAAAAPLGAYWRHAMRTRFTARSGRKRSDSSTHLAATLQLLLSAGTEDP